MTSQTLNQEVQKFLEEINKANINPAPESPSSRQNYKRIEYDEKSGLFRLISGQDITDLYYTAHNSETYFLRFKDFIKNLDSLRTTNKTEVSADAIKLSHWGYYDSSITIDKESKALIQRGRVHGFLELENKIFSCFGMNFSSYGKYIQIEGIEEYVEHEEIKKRLDQFLKEIRE